MKILLTKPKASRQSIKIRSSFLGNTKSSYKLVLLEIPIGSSWKHGSDIKSQTLLLSCSNTVVCFTKAGSHYVPLTPILFFGFTLFFCSFTVYIILQVLRNFSVKIFHIFTLTNIMCSYFGGRGWLLGHISFNDNSRTFRHFKNSVSKVFSVNTLSFSKFWKYQQHTTGRIQRVTFLDRKSHSFKVYSNNQNKCTYSNGEVCYINFPKSKVNKKPLPLNYCFVIL